MKPEEKAAYMQRWAQSREFFYTEALGVTLSDWQGEVVEELDSGETRISIRSGNGVGKTMLCALLALHFLLFRFQVKIVVTSPSSSQLSDGLYPEVVSWIGKLPSWLREHLEVKKLRIERVDQPENAFISFRTARKENPEALAGIHAENVMCIVDEASGVDDVVFEFAQGTLSTKGAIFVMIGNPTKLSGFFYDTHHKLKAFWKTHVVTSFDTPYVQQAFVDQIERTYGKDHNQYLMRVLGRFPTAEDDALMSRNVVMEALTRDIVSSASEVEIWGVDVGRTGADPSCLVKRRGRRVHYVKEVRFRDLMQLTGFVAHQYEETEIEDRPEAIHVDSIGLGAGVADRLRELGLPAIDVNVAEVSAMQESYARLRDECWFECRNFFEGKDVVIDLPEDEAEALIDELCAPCVIYTSSGKATVEPKLFTKKRIGRSPNRADALVMTFTGRGLSAFGARRSGYSNWDTPIVMETGFLP